jgi:AcrR family transcriptional regulator
MPATKPEGSARDRLLAAANELFYEEGIHTVGIDRVIERAGVAKASLYSTFGSKDELVRAYLASRAEARQRRIAEKIAGHEAPRDRILAVFDALGESIVLPTFRGCAFMNATAEGPRRDTPVSQVCADSRSWISDRFTELARSAGAADPAELGRQLTMLYDGATIAAAMDQDMAAATRARAMAALVIDAATASRTA